MKIEYSQDALQFLIKTQKSYVLTIRQAIAGLTKTPPEGDIKPMRGYSDGRQRLRVGKYRVIYRYSGEGDAATLHIIDIGSRGDIYK